MKGSPKFTVSGPGFDTSYPDFGPALSRSITEATRTRDEATFYVRDPAGQTVGRTERDADGIVRTWRL